MLQWAQRYHGTDTENNHPIGLEVDSLGNSYVTGAASIFNENSNFVTIKYNSSGVQQWIDLYNGPGSNSIDWPIGIKLDNNKNVIVCGHSESAGFGSDDYVLIKYNNSGTRLWVARYNSSGSFADTPYDMTVDNAGNIYVTGTSYNGTRNDALTIKYNSNGDSVWARRFNSAAVNTIGS
ncbi:MAG TPA: SBBP repeat-containing protein, partial [Ignavibacteria bacterium]|nr:SBBP repeat-containing protein [Ignavibacteria bacterium]